MGFRLFLALLSWFLISSQQLYGCLDEERRALIHLKLSFDVPVYDLSFGSWVRDRSDCCIWERVSCGSMTGRVQGLNMAFAWSGFQSYTMNATLFLPFQELRNLDLSGNYINGCVRDGGLDRLSNLSKLEFLDLSWNYLNESILPSLAALTSLKAVSLQGNNMGSDLPVHGFVAWSKLSKLQYLDLSWNAFNETLIPSLFGISSLSTLLLRYNEMSGRIPIRELCKLTRLEVLDLSENRFLGEFPTLQEEWTSLKVLSLSSNKLNGTLPVPGLCMIRNLHELDLSQNQLIGVLPSCLGNLTSLRYFDVSDNHLQVNFPFHPISNLISLEYLSLSNNQLEGILLFNSLSNHSNLKMLELVDQYNKLEVETESLVVAPAFQLEGIILSNCNLNKDSGAIPSFLSTQYALQWIDLSLNNLKGHIPNWLLENKTSLHYLNLHMNSLSGPLILPSQLNNSVSWLDLSMNEFSGEVPTNMGIIFPNLQYLNFSRNSFQGSIPFSFGYMRGLSILDLSDNRLSGKITENLLSNLSSVYELYLSNNNFHGKMPPYSNITTFFNLNLDGNRFTGEIPSIICSKSWLTNLDVSGNQLSGRLPNCLGSLLHLVSLNAEGNHLEGHIPNEFCNMGFIRFLDLSSNHLSGSIPPCFNLPYLEYLHLHDNGLTGPFPIALSSSPEIRTIDLRNNHLSGKLPSWRGVSLENLRVLLLGGNHFEGPIPNQMCLLKHLRILDLSHNTISGRIPLCFKKMGFQDAHFAPFAFASGNDGFIQNLFPYYRGRLPLNQFGHDVFLYSVDEEEFLTKSRSYSYKGDILNYMSGIDLSCNQLADEIPMEIGSMSWLRALNLSNNQLTGRVPHTLSNLKELESLDLSHNMLTGPLPREMTEMHSLAVFSVAYNNLSGPTLGRDGQFITFNESSYVGNPDLCGPPLEKNCTAALPTPIPDEDGDGDHGDDDAIDRLILFASFALAFVMGFWGYMAVLYFKVEWRYALFLTADRYTEAGFTKICGLLARIKSFW